MIKNKLLYQCSKCKHIELKKITLKDRLFKILFSIIWIILLVTSSIGILSMYNLFQTNSYDFNYLTNMGSAYASVVNIKEHFQLNDNLNSISKNIVKDCKTELCKLESIYGELIKFDYANSTSLSAIKIWEERAGDCDTISNLACTLLKIEGISCWLQCSINHCWVLAKIEDKEYILDVVNNIFKEKK